MKNYCFCLSSKSLLRLIIYIAIAKKGIIGILYRTKVPKLYEVKPTAHDNTKENIRQKVIITLDLLAFELSLNL